MVRTTNSSMKFPDAGDGPTGVIFDIKRFAIHDGPGIRTTVFLKGCPMACPWCQNPEGIGHQPEHAWRADRCSACGACVEACPNSALEMRNGRPVTDVERCVLCGRCVDACPTGAREIIGRRVSVGEVLAEIEKDRVFFETSGGGATFSGGEPLFQPEFLAELLAECRRRDIAVAVDTTCHAPWEVIEPLIPLVDLWLCDVKHADPAVHKRLTGVDNTQLLANLHRLAEAGVPMRIRMPIVPGMNDDAANLEATGRMLADLPAVADVDVLAYNVGGLAKARRLGRTLAATPVPDGSGGPEEPTGGHVAECAERLRAFGLNVTIGG